MKKRVLIIIIVSILLITVLGFILFKKHSTKNNQIAIQDEIYNKISDWFSFTTLNSKETSNSACRFSSNYLLVSKNVTSNFWDTYGPYFYFCEYGQIAATIDSEYGSYVLADAGEINKYDDMFPGTLKFRMFTQEIVEGNLNNDNWGYLYDEVNNAAKEYYNNKYLIIKNDDIIGEGSEFIYSLGKQKEENGYYVIDINAKSRINYGNGLKKYKGIIKYKIKNELPVFEKTMLQLTN